MYSLVSGFVNELANVAQGNVSNAVKLSRTLWSMLTLGIKLLADHEYRQISRAVNEALEKISDRIDGNVNTFIDWIRNIYGSLGIDPVASPDNKEVAKEPNLPKHKASSQKQAPLN